MKEQSNSDFLWRWFSAGCIATYGYLFTIASVLLSLLMRFGAANHRGLQLNEKLTGSRERKWENKPVSGTFLMLPSGLSSMHAQSLAALKLSNLCTKQRNNEIPWFYFPAIHRWSCFACLLVNHQPKAAVWNVNRVNWEKNVLLDSLG